MIAIVYGTTGELIKLAPVMRRLEQRGVPLMGVCTGQQIRQIGPMLTDFGLSDPGLWLGRGHRGEDLERPRDIPRWLAEVGIGSLRRRAELKRRLAADGAPLVIVHGDTMTTLLGATLGRLLGVPVAHIEAGMRSGNWRDPFPEELNRKATARLARIHFAPGPRAVSNLRAERVRGEIVNTEHNTIVDNLREIPAGLPPGMQVSDEPFGIVSLHRQELLYNRGALTATLTTLRESAHCHARLLFVDHSITAAAVRSAELDRLFDTERFVRIPRLRYFHFLSLVKASSFLFTDSGGSQEECAYLGHPCLIHRAVTEHSTGLDGSVVLSGMDQDVVRRFLEHPEHLRTDPVLIAESPSDKILRHLARRGLIPDASAAAGGEAAAMGAGRG